MPLTVRVITPGDYHLYLFAYKNKWFVAAEADYPPLRSLAKDIEDNFPVKVSGWLVLTSKQKEAGSNMLPPDCFSSDIANETDDNWRNSRYVFLEENSMRYALLQVTPKADVGIETFQVY